MNHNPSRFRARANHLPPGKPLIWTYVVITLIVLAGFDYSLLGVAS